MKIRKKREAEREEEGRGEKINYGPHVKKLWVGGLVSTEYL